MRLPRFVAWFGRTPSDAAVTSAIIAEQLRYLRRHLLATGCIQIVLASLVAAVAFGHVPLGVLVAWTIVVWVLGLRSMRSWLRHRHKPASTAPSERYIDRANLSALVTGLIWAVPGVFLFVPTNLPLQLFVLFVIGGMAAGATAGLSTLPVVWSGFVVLSLFPITIQFLLVREPLHLMFAALSLVTLVTLFVMARVNYQAFAEGIANRMRLDALAKEIEATREQLRDAIESTSDGFVLFDPDDRLIMCNSRYRDIYASIADVIEPGVRFEHVLRTAHQRGRFANIDDDLENWIATRLERHRTSGGYFDQVLTDGRTVRVSERSTAEGGVVGVHTDITDRVNAQQALNDQRAFLQKVVDTIPAIVNVKDQFGRYVLANAYLANLYGIPSKDVLGRLAADLDPVVDGRVRDTEEQALTPSETRSYVEEARDLGINGDTWITTRVPLPSEDGDAEYLLTVSFDISEQKRVEREHRASETRYRSLVESAPDAILINCDGKITFANAYALRLFGSANASDLIGSSTLDRVHPDYRGTAADRIAAVLSRETDVSPAMEQKLLRLDGSIIAVETRGGLIEWEGRPAVQVVIRDVTERNQTEQELRESERRYRTLVEQSPDAIVINQEAHIVFANQAALRLFGAASEADLLGLPAEQFVHPDLRQRAHERVGRVLKLGGGLPLSETRLLRLNGDPLDVEITGTTITWGGHQAVQLMMRDISDRKRTEAALHLTQFSVDHAADAVFWIRPSGGIAYANHSACRLLGYGHAELMDMTIDRIDPEMSLTAWGQFVERTRQAEFQLVHERRMRTKVGHLVPVEISQNFLEFGDDAYIFAFTRDISSRRAAEDRARRHEADLAQVLRTTTVGEMASALAEQLKRPLDSIASAAEESLERIRAGSAAPEELTDILERASDDVAYASGVVSDIGAFVRRSAPARHLVDANELVRDTLALATSELDASDVVCRLDLTTSLPRVPIDEIEIEQVILNIVRNGIEAMDGMRPSERTLTMCTGLASEHEVEIAITDSGPGLPFEALAKMFDPFFSTKPKHLGMGLTIARSLVEAHQGRLWATQNPNGGATFRIALAIELL